MKPSLVEAVLLRRAEEQVEALKKADLDTWDQRRANGRGGRPPVLTNAVLQAMQPDCTYTAAELARVVFRQRKVVNDILHRLCIERRVEKLERGVYRLLPPVPVRPGADGGTL
jgi:hypothetical protein